MLTSESKSSKYAILSFATFSMAFVSGALFSGIVPATLPDIEARFSLSHATIASVLGVLVLMSALFAFVGGHLADRMGHARMLNFAFLLSGIGLLGIGFAGSRFSALLWAFWAYLGLGMGRITNAVIVELYDHNRVRGVNLLHAVNGIGKMSGPLLAIVFVRFAGWGAPYAAVGVFVLFLFILCRFSKAEPLRKTRFDPAFERDAIRSPLRRPLFWFCVLGFVFYIGSEYPMVLWMVSYYEKVRGLNPDQARILLMLLLSGLTLGRFLFAGYAIRLDPKTIILLCALFLFIFFVPAILTESFILLIPIVFLLGVAFSAPYPTFFAYIVHFFPKHKGMLSGAVSFSTLGGIALSSALSGLAAEWGLVWALAFSPMCMLLFVGLFMAIYKTMSNEQ